MAGRLTANAVTAEVRGNSIEGDVLPIATVAMLSPVDGANNVLLTACAMITELDETEILTFQWYRCQPTADINTALVGDAVGDPFVIDTGITELITAPVVIQAIDRGPALTSAYALTVVSEEELELTVEALYADAVLYD